MILLNKDCNLWHVGSELLLQSFTNVVVFHMSIISPFVCVCVCVGRGGGGDGGGEVASIHEPYWLSFPQNKGPIQVNIKVSFFYQQVWQVKWNNTKYWVQIIPTLVDLQLLTAKYHHLSRFDTNRRSPERSNKIIN